MARRDEADLKNYDLSKGTRGKYFDKARRSFETIVVDKKVLDALGGSDAIREILEVLARSLASAKKKRRAA